jgi:hypothetical protein
VGRKPELISTAAPDVVFMYPRNAGEHVEMADKKTVEKGMG